MNLQDEPNIDLNERISLITNHPFFGLLSANDIAELAKLMQVRQIPPQSLIVKEGEVTDEIFLITQGEAEVTRQIKTLDKSVEIPLAILHAGDAIGLSNEGFSSQHGERTATIKALSDMVLLWMTLKDFTEFMNSPTRLYPGIKDQAKNLLRMAFIKDIVPFMGLNVSRISELAQLVEIEQFSKNSVIFRQGDIGDKIYLIQSGQIQIQLTDKNGNTRNVAILQSSDIFGENAFLYSIPRNATAFVLEDSQLLSLNYKFMRKIMKFSPNIELNLHSLARDRRIPSKNRKDVAIVQFEKAGEKWIVLQDKESHHYCYLPAEGEYIWDMINDQHSIEKIIKLSKDKFGNEVEKIVRGALDRLNTSGFISIPKSKTSKSFWSRVLKKLHLIKY